MSGAEATLIALGAEYEAGQVEFQRCDTLINSVEGTSGGGYERLVQMNDDLCTRLNDLQVRIADVPAEGLAGAAVKARIVRRELQDNDGELMPTHVRLAIDVADVLDRLAVSAQS